MSQPVFVGHPQPTPLSCTTRHRCFAYQYPVKRQSRSLQALRHRGESLELATPSSPAQPALANIDVLRLLCAHTQYISHPVRLSRHAGRQPGQEEASASSGWPTAWQQRRCSGGGARAQQRAAPVRGRGRGRARRGGLARAHRLRQPGQLHPRCLRAHAPAHPPMLPRRCMLPASSHHMVVVVLLQVTAHAQGHHKASEVWAGVAVQVQH